MAQLTVRLEDDLAGAVKAHATARGQSVNSWLVAVLRAATDPELADSDTERTRARLARAGLLTTPTGRPSAPRPDPAALARARRAAGRGTQLSTLVATERE